MSTSSDTVPLQLTLAMFECTYLRGTYLSPPAILPKTVLEASLALPYPTTPELFEDFKGDVNDSQVHEINAQVRALEEASPQEP